MKTYLKKKFEFFFFWIFFFAFLLFLLFFLFLKVRRPGRKTSGFRTVRILTICQTSGPDVMSGWVEENINLSQYEHLSEIKPPLVDLISHFLIFSGMVFYQHQFLHMENHGHQLVLDTTKKKKTLQNQLAETQVYTIKLNILFSSSNNYRIVASRNTSRLVTPHVTNWIKFN